MIKTVTRLEFRDTSIDKIKVDDLEFSYTNKKGIDKQKVGESWRPIPPGEMDPRGKK